VIWAVGFWGIMEQRSFSISELVFSDHQLVFCFAFLIGGNFQGCYYDMIYIKPHTQKQTLAKSIEKLSEIDIVLSEQLMNPIKSWKFLRNSIHF
jgi:hypothetical protein